ncbi:MAG: hypothetical protein AAGF88_03710 [Pseudomonadota bacterium]
MLSLTNGKIRAVLLAPLAVSLAISTAAAQTEQDATSQFVTLWTDFLQFCGPGLSDPDAVFSTQTRFEGYAFASWYLTPEDTGIVIDHISEDFGRAMTMNLMRGQAGYTMDCEAEISSEEGPGGWVTDELASAVRGMIESNDDMVIAGGDLELHPASNSPLVDLENFNFQHFVVEGVFPDQAGARVLVELSDVVMSIILYTDWERE